MGAGWIAAAPDAPAEGGAQPAPAPAAAPPANPAPKGNAIEGWTPTGPDQSLEEAKAWKPTGPDQPYQPPAAAPANPAKPAQPPSFVDKVKAQYDKFTSGPEWSTLAKAYPHVLGAQFTRLGAGVQEAVGAGEVRSAEMQAAALNVLPQVAARLKVDPQNPAAGIQAMAADPLVKKTAIALGLDPQVFASQYPLIAGMNAENQADAMSDARNTMIKGQDNVLKGKDKRLTAWAEEKVWTPSDLTGGKLDPWTVKGLAFNTALAIPDMAAVAGVTVGTTVATGNPGLGAAAGGATAVALFAPAQRAQVKDKIDDQVDRILQRADALDDAAPIGGKRGLNPVTSELRQQAHDLAASSDKIADTAAFFYGISDMAGSLPVANVLANSPAGKVILDRIVGSAIAKTAGGRVAGAMVANGAGGVVQASLQKAVDTGIVHEKTSLKDALQDIAYTGVVSAITAGPIAYAHEVAGAPAREAARRNLEADELRDRVRAAADNLNKPPSGEEYPGYKWNPQTSKYEATGGGAPGAIPPARQIGTETPNAGTKPPETGGAAPSGDTFAEKQETLNNAAAAAEKRSDVTLEPEEEGWSVHVKGEPVATFGNVADARQAMATARKLVGTGKSPTQNGDQSGINPGNNPERTPDKTPTQESELERTQPIERRSQGELRQRVTDMTPEQAKAALLTHELTGIPNRRAYEDSAKKPAQVSVDVDSLKWVNDNAGHAGGDELLKAVAQALHEGSGGNAYHISGDEFVVQGDDAQSAERAMEGAKDRLAGATLTFKHPDGRTVELKGIGLSHGTGTSLEEAEGNLASAKSQRQQSGLRAARGEQPPGASVALGEAGVQAGKGHAAAQDLAPNGTPRIKSRTSWHGLPIGIENPANTFRSFKFPDGSTGKRKMRVPYGEFTKTEGADGDGVDVFLGHGGGSSDGDGQAYVIDQTTPDGKAFDEHKVILGVNGEDAARKLYLDHYQEGWKGLGAITKMNPAKFKEWLKGDTTQPVAWKPPVERKAPPRIPPDAKRDSILQYLARHPQGLDREEAIAQGVDPEDMKLGTAHVGIQKAFRQGGMSFDRAAEHLHEAGYRVADAEGHYNPNTLMERISDELAGRPHYSVHNQEHTEALAREAFELREPFAPIEDVHELNHLDDATLREYPGDAQKAGDKKAIKLAEQVLKAHVDEAAEDAKRNPPAVLIGGDPYTAQTSKRVLGQFREMLGQARPLADYRKAYEAVAGDKASGPAIKTIDELVERAIVENARGIVAEADEPKATFEKLVALYERQPNLSTRTSTSVEEQAYSTPAPLAFLASDLAGVTPKTTVLEPTAGNGMLLIAASPEKATVNEINPARASSLKAQGFRVTSKDASAHVLADGVDVVLANPPFGVVKDAGGVSKTFTVKTPLGHGVKTNEIDHAIALEQLKAMKPDGRAVLLVAGVNKLARTPEARSDAYNGAAKRKFYYHLYGNYNVVDHFTVAGELYSRQGAAWPIDIIVIHGTGKSALDLPAAAPPRVYDNYPALAELLGRNYDDIAASRVLTAGDTKQSLAGVSAVPGESSNGPTVVPELPRGPDTGHGELSQEPAQRGQPVRVGDVQAGAAAEHGVLPAERGGEPAGGVEPERVGEAGLLGGLPRDQVTEAGADDGQPSRAEIAASGQGLAGGQSDKVGIADGSGGVGQRVYRPSSKSKPVGTLVPGNMGDSIADSLRALESRVGPVDAYVAQELGYPPKSISHYFSAEQVDALGLAIEQIKRNSGFIIGDQTGVGKGRVVAGVIRWAIKNGRVPIFVTEKPNLYADMMRDLRDIGMEDIRPLMTNAQQRVPLDGGGEIKTGASNIHNAMLQRMADTSDLGNFNMLFTTYNQMQTVQGKATSRMALLNSLGRRGMVVFDESHNAGGSDSGRKNARQLEADGGSAKTGRAAFARGLSNLAQGTFYSSATYAKRPSVMDLYGKTDMRLAVKGNVDKLPAAIAAGGVPLQQVVASMLAKSGQYIRRERSFEGVEYNTPVTKVSREAAEAISSMMLAIKEFDDTKGLAVERMKERAKREAKSVSEDGSVGAAGAESTNFTSVMHNLISQMLLALKADAAADRAIEALKRGEKPVITLANTMGSFIGDYVDGASLKGGDRIGIGFRDLMRNYLEKSRMVTIKDQEGNKTRIRLGDEDLGPAGMAFFKRAKDVIEKAPDIDKVPLSPIDWIHHRLREEGYTSGEITGRQHTIEYQKSGEPIYRPRSGAQTSIAARRKAITGFNEGGLDALVLNQAGSTGLSLHASEKFKDQRRRRMILAQAEGNIDTHMQMLGRVHRTGQVVAPAYDQLVADIPAEKRPAAVLAKKMASLNANTTGARSSQFSSKETTDFINQYGDEVVAQLMSDMPEVHERLGEPLESGDDGYVKEDAARRVTGRMPMLPVAEQERLYEAIESNYRNRLAQADAMGENAIEAKTLPLDAKALEKVVLTEGVTGHSPFAGPSHAETMDVKRIGKPYSSAQVRELVAKRVGDMTKAPPLAKLASAGREQAGKEIERVIKEYAEYRDGQEAKMLKSDTEQAAREGRLTALDGVKDAWRRIAETVHVGGSYEIRMADQTLYGIVTDIARKPVQMPTALGSWAVHFALADGSKQMWVPFSQIAVGSPQEGKITVESRPRNQLTGAPIETMFDDGQTVSREKRVIMTGNLLAAFSAARGGQVIHFESQGGEVRQGILMPRTFKLKDFIDTAPITVPAEGVSSFLGRAQQGVLTTGDGALRVQKWGNGQYALLTAKSKSEGGKYFLDKGLRDIVGDFVSSGDTMRAIVDRAKFEHAVNYIQDSLEQKFETTNHRTEAMAAGGKAMGTSRVAHKVGSETGSGMPAEQIRSQVNAILSKFASKPPVVVADNIGQLRGMQELAGRVHPEAIAFLDPKSGKMYVVASRVHSPDQLAGIVAHEYVTHYGLRAALGSRAEPAYRELLDGVAKAMPADVLERGRAEFGKDFDPENPAHHYIAAEETLAYYGEQYAKDQSIPGRIRRFIDRLIGMVRDWIRNVLGLAPKFDETFIKRTLGDLEAFLRRKNDIPTPQERAPAVNAMPHDTFYSALSRAVDSAKREKGTGAEWEATLRNMPGVKQAEIEWTGLKGFLEGRGKVTKAEVADYVHAHQVQLGEVMHGGRHQQNALTEGDVAAINIRMTERGYGDLDPEQVAALMHGGRDTMDMIEALHRMGIDASDFYSDTALPHEGVVDRLGELGYQVHEDDVTGQPYLMRHDDTAGYAMEVADGDVSDEARDLLDSLRQGDMSPVKYESHATPGGENYRELLLTLPGENIPPAEKSLAAMTGAERTAHYQRNMPNFYSQHWDEPNVMAHVRFDDRVGQNGERVLHIHEVQSDWHQQGRRFGYRPANSLHLTPEEVRKITDVTLDRWEAMTTGQRNALESIAAREATKMVPNAPFATTWPELAMKRMLRYAAENGYDALSWDTGDTNAERYNMQSIADKITIDQHEPGVFDLIATKDGKTVTESRNLNDEKLAQYVGKDMAQKAAQQQGLSKFEGEGLKVGGSGMRGFYDDMLPKMVQKIAKRFGSSVEPGRLPYANPEPTGSFYITENPPTPGFPNGSYRVMDHNTLRQSGAYATRERAEEVMRQYEAAYATGSSELPAHMVKITPAMRDSLMLGQPMFLKRRPKGAQPADGRGIIPRAYDLGRKAVAAIPGNEITMSFRRILDPSGVSDLAKGTANLARDELGQLAHKSEEAIGKLEGFSKAFDLLKHDDRLNFIDAMEKGDLQPVPELQPAADAIRKLLDDTRTRVQELGVGALESFIENYFPHIWKDPKGASRVFASIFGSRPLKGPASFLKQRTIPTTREGIDKGLIPVSTNPLILAFAKVREMERFITGTKLMQRLKQEGLAKFLPAMKRMPEGWVKINDAVGRVLQWSEQEKGFVIRGYYIMPADAGRVINNHLGESALRNFIPAQLWRSLTNVVTPLQLGFSAFHLGFTTLDAVVSKNALGIERLIRGEALGAMRAFLEANGVVSGPLMNIRRGMALRKAYTDVGTSDPLMKRIIEGLEAAGGRVKMDTYYMAGQGQSPFKGVGFAGLASELKAVMTQSQSKVADAGKVLASFPRQYADRLWNDLVQLWHEEPFKALPIKTGLEVAGRTVRASTAIIMEHIVPLQKLGVFSDLARDHILRNPNEHPVDFANAMQKIWDSVDNRLGEMVYDNLFWNRTFKEVNHMAVRAVGWNAGTVRELGGAPIDVVKVLDYMARGAPPELPAAGLVNDAEERLKYKTAQGAWERIAEKIGHKIPYTIALLGTTMLLGAIITRLLTGKGPEEVKDYFFPPTGRMTKYGTKERISLPAYTKDIYEYGTQPVTTIINKANPMFGMIHAIYANEDFFGDRIRNPDAGFWEQLKESAAYSAKETMPFSLQGGKQFAGAGEMDTKAKVLSVAPYFGLTPAPARVTSPEQMEHYQHREDEQKYLRGLMREYRKAMEAKDSDAIEKLRAQIIQTKQHLKATQGEIKVDKSKARAAAEKISGLVSGKSKTEAVAALKAAGYPAFAQLWESMPDRPRPRVAESLEAFA